MRAAVALLLGVISLGHAAEACHQNLRGSPSVITDYFNDDFNSYDGIAQNDILLRNHDNIDENILSNSQKSFFYMENWFESIFALKQENSIDNSKNFDLDNDLDHAYDDPWISWMDLNFTQGALESIASDASCFDPFHNHSYYFMGDDRQSYNLSSIMSCKLPLSECNPLNQTVVCPLLQMGEEQQLDYAPVCGCDKKTYSNACNARYFGCINCWTTGPCA